VSVFPDIPIGRVIMELDRLLARARHLELKTRHLARSHYTGLFRSAFRGQGMEFAEVREYSEGDDVRLIDWNVSARSQSLYVKRMAEERERNVLLLVDGSGSLAFGSVRRTKSDLLVEIASLLVISAYFARDRVSLAVFRSKVEPYVPAAKGWNHAARLIREMVSMHPHGRAGNLEAVWAFLNSPGVPRSLVLCLSDFQAPWLPSNSFAAACRKHELVTVLVSDPREWSLPPVGRIRLHDPETGGGRVINTRSAKLRSAYEDRARHTRKEVEQLFRSNGVEWLELSTGSAYEAALRRFLELRGAKGLSRNNRSASARAPGGQMPGGATQPVW